MLLIGFCGFGLLVYPASRREYTWEEAMAENDLRYRNARLRRKIDGALKAAQSWRLSLMALR
jgi:hypothetical protein